MKNVLNPLIQSAITWSLIGFIGGICSVFLFLRYKELDFKNEITAGNALQAFTTFALAITVTWFLQKQTQSKRKEKDILIDHLDLLLEEVSSLEEANEKGEMIAITSSLKRFRMNANSVQEILIDLNYPSKVCAASALDISELRKLCTDTPIKELEEAANSSSDQIKDGIMNLTAGRRSLIENTIHKLKLSIIRLKILINE